MTLDTRYPELDLFLHRLRRQLNLRFLAGEALAAAWAAGPLAALGALVLPVPPNPLILWAGLFAALVVLWTGLRWRRRLTLGQAASWFDQDQNTRGLFRAAADALDREALVFPDEVNLRAADLHRKVARPRFPWRRLALRLPLALLTAALSAGAVLLPPLLGLPTPSWTAQNPAAPEPRAEAPAPSLGDPTQGLSPGEAARRLFPEDERLAALAEQALASGDTGALDALLRQNPAQAAPPQSPESSRSRPGEGSRPPGQQSPGQGQGSEGEGDQAPDGEAGDPGAQSGSPGREGGVPKTSPDRKGSPSPGPQGNGPGPGGPGSGQGSPGKGGPPESAEDGPMKAPPGGGIPGTIHSDQKLGVRGELPSNDKRVSIPDKAAPGVFEYVLPETGARVPLAEAAAHSRRAAEASISRSSAPMEYENAIRDYFLSLSQEAKP